MNLNEIKQDVLKNSPRETFFCPDFQRAYNIKESDYKVSPYMKGLYKLEVRMEDYLGRGIGQCERIYNPDTGFLYPNLNE